MSVTVAMFGFFADITQPFFQNVMLLTTYPGELQCVALFVCSIVGNGMVFDVSMGLIFFIKVAKIYKQFVVFRTTIS